MKKTLERSILWLWIQLCNLLTFACPKKQGRVVFVSYFSHKPGRDIQLITSALRKQGVQDIVYMGQSFRGGLRDKVRYFVGIFRQVYHYNTAKVFVIDGNSPVASFLHGAGKARSVQIWHAAGAFKKFGADVERRYKLKGYDAVIVTSDFCRPIYSSALSTPLEQVFALGKARTDLLYDPSKQAKLRAQMLERYPHLKGKKVVLYAPTFRGGGTCALCAQEVDVRALASGLHEDYTLVCKFHPLIAGQIEGDFVNLTHESLYRIFSITDILITDYSSVCIEFSLTSKPVVLFAPDLEEYLDNRGLYFDLQELAPGPVCRTVEETIQAIHTLQPDKEKMERFQRLFFNKADGKASERIAKLIRAMIEGEAPNGNDEQWR